MKRFFLILLALTILASVCSCKKGEVVESGDDNVEQETVDTSGTFDNSAVVTDETRPFERYDEETNKISTPYGPLSYPAEWQDTVTTEVTESEASYVVKFFANLDSKTVPLYNIVFGESETGYKLGELTADNGTVVIYCEDFTAEREEQLSEASKETYNNLCMGLNNIISSLVYENGMITN